MTTSNEHNNAPAVPPGWKLVPIEPTREMIKAMEGQWLIGSQADMAKREYSAMLAATPAPAPAQEVGLTPAEIDRAVLEATGFDGFGTQPMNTHDTRNIGLEVIAALRAKGQT